MLSNQDVCAQIKQLRFDGNRTFLHLLAEQLFCLLPEELLSFQDNDGNTFLHRYCLMPGIHQWVLRLIVKTMPDGDELLSICRAEHLMQHIPRAISGLKVFKSFDNLFPGFETETHGISLKKENGKIRYYVPCVK